MVVVTTGVIKLDCFAKVMFKIGRSDACCSTVTPWNSKRARRIGDA